MTKNKKKGKKQFGILHPCYAISEEILKKKYGKEQLEN